MKDNKHGGARPNAGRKKSTRELKKATYAMFADQLPATSAEVRAAVDEYRKQKADLVQ